MKIKTVIDYFEGFAPLDTAMSFDNVGLLVGSPETEVGTVLVALDITPEVVEEAEAIGAGLIVSHHPVIFDPLKSIADDSVVYRLIKKNIAALCMHTNLDLSPDFGVNTCLADSVGLKNYGFVEGECLLIGELDEQMTNRAFAEKVKTALGCDGLRYTLPDKRVRKIALCSGSGGDLVELAEENGADALLTGEIKHHYILEANMLGLAVIDAGHFKTENVVAAPLCDRLKREFPELNVVTSERCTDGIHYL